MSEDPEKYNTLEGPDFKPFQRPLSPEPTQIRIEALRAAAMVVGGQLSSRGPTMAFTGQESPDVLTKHVAEQFAAWLEGK